MSEPSDPVQLAGLGGSAPEAPHAGAVVRAAREARGQTLLHLSILLKITERRLQAFEEGRWADVGDRTFVRALAQSLCKHLDLDPQPVLQSLPAVAVQPHAQPDRGRLTGTGAPSLKSLRRPVQMPGGGGSGWVTPVRLGVAVILAGALALAFSPSEWWAPAPQKESTVVEVPTAAPAAAVPASEGPAVAPAVVPAVVPAPASEPAPAAVAPPLVSPSPATVPTTPAGVQSASAGDPATSPLQLRATQDTWVQVTDSKGTLVFSRLLRTGERVGLEGVRPLRLRVGNVSGTEVVWQGRRVALEDSQRNNVADVELP